MSNLQELREKIDLIDQEIIAKIEQRLSISIEIAKLKTKTPGRKIRNKHRELEILENWKKQAKISSLNFIEKTLNLILKESRKIQSEYLKKNK